MKKTVTRDMLKQSAPPPPSVQAMLGQRRGRFMVRGFAGFRKSVPYIDVLCDCGASIIVNAYHATQGRSSSCGCLRVDHPNRLKHGYAPLYRKQPSVYTIWKGMHKRCSNENEKAYRHYGGRGIDVCARWSGEHGFENFLSDMGEPAPGMSIERTDNNADYSPDNCRWIPRGEQSKNRRYNWRVSIAGEEMTAREASRRLGLHPSAIDLRLRRRGLSKSECVPLERFGLG